MAQKPHRPHLPFPHYYRLDLTGEIKIDQLLDNPTGGESVISVTSVALKVVVDQFMAQKGTTRRSCIVLHPGFDVELERISARRGRFGAKIKLVHDYIQYDV